ncbi:metallophosphoesterase [Singulisphaera acidiphila]|uniref:Putative phosphohydrolase n=1 Tax=Singulisphaera acidiphila (strain ATCC BAA-1392 / DSM 18658 / VKM B-2454 / MOB10) TaxID=886293 RepID=L0DDL9_SINAD|nr:metallophosphoesterase [Singulisphaera acidiphila]AGA26913.1 putative phosphohydrolase [Singulisphaera acidiphila DSM 18658]
MILNWSLAGLVAIGHVGIFVYLTNLLHGVGIMPPSRERVGKVHLSMGLLVSGALAWEFFQGSGTYWSWPIRGYALLCLVVALIGIPVCSLLIHRRRIPDGIAEHTSDIDLAHRLGKENLIGSGRHSWLLRIKGNDSFRLRKREWTVTVPTLPAVWDGLSIVQVSDLHFAPCFQQRFFEHIADEAAEWPADLVVFTGDLIDHDLALDWIVPVMSRLSGRLGTFSILGNHDFDHRPTDVQKRLEEAGFVDVEGIWTQLKIEGMTLALGGTSTPWGPKLDLNAAPDADFRLFLSHSPDQFPGAVESGIDLMLSGHNHGGQIRLPGIGPVFMPSRYSRHFDRGYFRSGRTLLHVSQGVAGKHPIRFGCIPEISRLVLRVGHESSLSSSTPQNARLSQDATPRIFSSSD